MRCSALYGHQLPVVQTLTHSAAYRHTTASLATLGLHLVAGKLLLTSCHIVLVGQQFVHSYLQITRVVIELQCFSFESNTLIT